MCFLGRFRELPLKIPFKRTWRHEYWEHDDESYVIRKVIQCPFQWCIALMDQWDRTNMAELKCTIPPSDIRRKSAETRMRVPSEKW